MPYVYRNSNTGDEVTYEEKDVRLDHLDNWTLIAEPKSEGTEAAGNPPETPADEPTANSSKATRLTRSIKR